MFLYFPIQIGDFHGFSVENLPNLEKISSAPRCPTPVSTKSRHLYSAWLPCRARDFTTLSRILRGAIWGWLEFFFKDTNGSPHGDFGDDMVDTGHWRPHATLLVTWLVKATLLLKKIQWLWVLWAVMIHGCDVAMARIEGTSCLEKSVVLLHERCSSRRPRGFLNFVWNSSSERYPLNLTPSYPIYSHNTIIWPIFTLW